MDQEIENPFEGWAPLDEAAHIVGWSRSAVTYWADQGYIVSFPVGQRVRVVNLDEVKAYADERRRTKKHHPKRKFDKMNNKA
jgi:hypothetical protein